MSEDAEFERGRISKIRARHGTRLRAAQTAGAADSHESPRREREVVRRKVGHAPRHYPVGEAAGGGWGEWGGERRGREPAF